MCQDLIKGGTAMPTTSNRIKELRANLGKTMQEIAEKTGIKKSTIGSYETRGINPNAEKLKY
jgi:transcriptional regulator with XRE-family HTH domain